MIDIQEHNKLNDFGDIPLYFKVTFKPYHVDL